MRNEGTGSSATTRLLWTVLVPFASGFLLSNYFRTVNAVLSPRLIADLHLTASDLGLLTSIYFFTTALFQLPLGLLIDRYGPRRVQAALMAIAAVGGLIFALGEVRIDLLLGRAIMGIGAAGALMTSFQAVILWFPPRRWPFYNGCILSGGGLGALAATFPTEAILQFLDWRGIMLAAAAISIAVSLLTFGAVPERVERSDPATWARQISGMRQIYRDHFFWRLAPMYALTIGGTLAFQGLWSAPWLKDVAHLSANEVAGDLLVLSVLQIISYVVVGLFADVLGRRGIGLVEIVAVGTALFLISELPLVMSSGSGRWLVLFGMGSLANVSLLCFPILGARFPATLMGRASTALNLIVFAAAFIIQYIVGVIIDLFPGEPSGGYPVQAYHVAFGTIVAAQVLGWIWYAIPTGKAYFARSD